MSEQIRLVRRLPGLSPATLAEIEHALLVRLDWYGARGYDAPPTLIQAAFEVAAAIAAARDLKG